MQLDTDTLGTFYEMARQGAGLSAERLTRLTGTESRVRATRIEFSTPGRIRAELDGDDHAGTVVSLTGGIEGRTVLLFEVSEARSIAEMLVDDLEETAVSRSTEGLVASAVPEVCGIINNGFVDGWANVLDREIGLSTPEYVSGDRIGDVVDPQGGGELALVFRSTIVMRGREVSFRHYFVPDTASVTDLFAADSGIEYESLAGFDRVAQRGTDRVAADLSQMLDTETTVDVRRVSFISLDAIPEAVSNERVASVAFSFTGTPGGYLLFLFGESSARQLVGTMLGTDSVEAVGEMGRDAIQEASNIMASGLLDGWANVLDSTIEHSTPTFAWELGPAAVDPLVVALSQRQEFAFVFDTRIRTDDEAFDAEVYVIPDADDLEAALAAIDIGRVETASPTADIDIDDLDDEALNEVEDPGEVEFQ